MPALLPPQTDEDWTDLVASEPLPANRPGHAAALLRAVTIRVPAGALAAYEVRIQALGIPYERVEFDDGGLALYLDGPDGNVLELSD